MSDLALNGNHNISDCLGSLDTSVDPPVIRYQLPVNHSQENPCRHSLQVRAMLNHWNDEHTFKRTSSLSGFDRGLDCGRGPRPLRSLQQLLDHPVSCHHRVHRHTQSGPGPHQLLHGPLLSLLLPLPAGVPDQQHTDCGVSAICNRNLWGLYKHIVKFEVKHGD